MQDLEKLKINTNYAPGIATYGIDGEKGEKGLDGNNIYFTNMPIDEELLSSDIINKIKNNILLINGSNEKLTREYQNGDYFFNEIGAIYTLQYVEDLKSLDINTTINDSNKLYFVLAGRITLQDIKEYFEIIQNNEHKKRLSINPDYNGFDIICGNYSDISSIINTNVAMNIISNNIVDNKIYLLHLNAINELGVNDGSLIIYYDINTNTYHFESNNSLILDSNVKINDTQELRNVDEYSTVLTSNNTITYFKYLCDNIYAIVENVELYTENEETGEDELELYVGVVLNLGNNEEIVLQIKKILNATYMKAYVTNSNYCYHLSDYEVGYHEADNDDTNAYYYILIRLNDTILDSSLVMMLSLLYNTEIFLSITR